MRAISRKKWLDLLSVAPSSLFAGAVAVSSLSFKSQRSNGSMQWADGAKWWVAIGFVGGLMILAVLAWGVHSGRLLMPSIIASVLFSQIGRVASDYRTHLESTFHAQNSYTEQHFAFGLKVVPFLCALGTVASMCLVLALLMTPRSKLRRRVITEGSMPAAR